MAFFEWSNKLDVGVAEMNQEHKQLIHLMNTLHQQKSEGASFDQLSQSLSALGAYTQKHFADEEAYMSKIQMPNLETHKIIHKNLLEKFTTHVNQFKQSKVLPPEFFDFLTFWLNAHIQGIDSGYGQHAQKLKPKS